MAKRILSVSYDAALLNTRRMLLEHEGYDVTYHEYEGGHATPLFVIRDAFEWFVKSGK